MTENGVFSKFKFLAHGSGADETLASFGPSIKSTAA